MRASSGLTYFLLIIQYQYPVKDLLPRFWSQAPSQQLDSFISNLHLCCLGGLVFCFLFFYPGAMCQIRLGMDQRFAVFWGERQLRKKQYKKNLQTTAHSQVNQEKVHMKVEDLGINCLRSVHILLQPLVHAKPSSITRGPGTPFGGSYRIRLSSHVRTLP